MNRWTVERRVCRAPGDRDKEMPQVIAEGFAQFTWGCFDTEDHRRWCGARHPNEGIAVDHAGLLNAGIREERK